MQNIQNQFSSAVLSNGTRTKAGGRCFPSRFHEKYPGEKEYTVVSRFICQSFKHGSRSILGSCWLDT